MTDHQRHNRCSKDEHKGKYSAVHQRTGRVGGNPPPRPWQEYLVGRRLAGEIPDRYASMGDRYNMKIL